MTTASQTIVTDIILSINTKRKKNNIIEYKRSRSQLISPDVIDVEGKFFELEKITLTYRLGEDEIRRYCKLSIPGYKIIEGKEIGDRIIRFEFAFDKHFGFCDAFLKNKTKDGQSHKIWLRFNVIPKFYVNYNNIDGRYYMHNDLRKMRIDIYNKIFGHTKIPEDKIGSNIQTIEEQFSTIYNTVKRLKRVIDYISLNPSAEIIKEKIREKISIAEIDYATSSDMAYDLAIQDYGFIKIENKTFASTLKNIPSDKNGNKYLPDSIPSYKKIKIYNVIQNQLFKGFLTVMIYYIKQFRIKYEDLRYKTGREDANRNIELCDELCKDIEEMVMYTFLENVDEMDDIEDIVNNMYILRGDYAGLYDIIEEFIKSPVFDDLTNNLSWPINETHNLYENWVILKLFDIIIDLCNQRNWNFKKQNIIDDDMHLILNKLRKGLLIQLKTDNDKNVYFFRKKNYHRYTGGTVQPDTSIEKEYDKRSKVSILDPKYRSVLKAEEKNEMAIYKELITRDGIRIVESGIVIYPGETKMWSVSKKNRKDSIGGMKLLPVENNNKDIENIKSFILDFINDN